MIVTENLKRELTADIMNALSDAFGRFLEPDQHLKATEIVHDHIHKAFSPQIWNVIGECLKADQPWTEREVYHCNCKDKIGGKLDPRPCPEHPERRKR